MNASTDLRYFERIIPCGIRDKTVTSLSHLTGRSITPTDLMEPVAASFGRTFGMEMAWIGAEALFEIAQVSS